MTVMANTMPEEFFSTFDPREGGVVVFGMHAADRTAVEALDRLLTTPAMPPVVVLAVAADVDLCRRALKGGAAEFLLRPVESGVLMGILEQELRTDLQRRERIRAECQAPECYMRLTPRERQVFGLMVSGLTNREIARELFRSSRTVEVHRARIAGKPEVPTFAQLLLRYALMAECPTAG